MFVKVKVQIDSEAGDNNCYKNCVAKVRRDGGEVVLGWRRTPMTTRFALIASLDHHAVWRSPSDELIDISPRVVLKGDHLIPGIIDSEIDFEIDPDANFDTSGQSKPSRYVPIAPDKFGLLKRACDRANQEMEHRAAGRTDKANHANKKVIDFLEQHRRQANR